MLRGHSAVLGLELWREDDRLRFFDPEDGEYLLSFEEQNLAMEEMDRARLVTQ